MTELATAAAAFIALHQTAFLTGNTIPRDRYGDAFLRLYLAVTAITDPDAHDATR